MTALGARKLPFRRICYFEAFHVVKSIGTFREDSLSNHASVANYYIKGLQQQRAHFLVHACKSDESWGGGTATKCQPSKVWHVLLRQCHAYSILTVPKVGTRPQEQSGPKPRVPTLTSEAKAGTWCEALSGNVGTWHLGGMGARAMLLLKTSLISTEYIALWFLQACNRVSCRP